MTWACSEGRAQNRVMSARAASSTSAPSAISQRWLGTKYARSLRLMDQVVREICALAVDLSAEAIPGLALEYRYQASDL